MPVTYERICICGESVSYTGSRRGEREAKDQWEQRHAGHVPEKAAVSSAPIGAVGEAPERLGRRAR